MSACSHHKETLMLDIFGELNQNRKDAWKRHLGNCPDCAAENETITQTLNIVQTTLDAPSLGEFEAAAMRKSVIRDLTIGAEKPRERKQPFFFSRAFVPALASACVLVIVIGFMASKVLTGPGINKSAHLAVLQEQLPADDLAIIDNLDLLTNLDALDRLSRAIDQSQPPSPDNNVQGKYGYGKKTFFS